MEQTKPTEKPIEEDPWAVNLELARIKKEAENDKFSRGMTGALSELMFVILPFVVIAMTLGHRDELRSIFYIPEWSIVSAVISGQTVARIVSITVGRSLHRERVVLSVSVFFVFILVPILVILAIVLTSDKVSTALAWTQAVLFVVSLLSFFMATTAERLLAE